MINQDKTPIAISLGVKVDAFKAAFQMKHLTHRCMQSGYFFLNSGKPFLNFQKITDKASPSSTSVCAPASSIYSLNFSKYAKSYTANEIPTDVEMVFHGSFHEFDCNNFIINFKTSGSALTYQ